MKDQADREARRFATEYRRWYQREFLPSLRASREAEEYSPRDRAWFARPLGER